jgi:hypothetical protein
MAFAAAGTSAGSHFLIEAVSSISLHFTPKDRLPQPRLRIKGQWNASVLLYSESIAHFAVNLQILFPIYRGPAEKCRRKHFKRPEFCVRIFLSAERSFQKVWKMS